MNSQWLSESPSGSLVLCPRQKLSPPIPSLPPPQDTGTLTQVLFRNLCAPQKLACSVPAAQVTPWCSAESGSRLCLLLANALRIHRQTLRIARTNTLQKKGLISSLLSKRKLSFQVYSPKENSHFQTWKKPPRFYLIRKVNSALFLLWGSI